MVYRYPQGLEWPDSPLIYFPARSTKWLLKQIPLENGYSIATIGGMLPLYGIEERNNEWNEARGGPSILLYSETRE